jgi:anti-sigma factor (TIGR02949 family)
VKCPDIRQELSAYLDGELDNETADALHRHLTDCPACRAELEALRRTVAAVKELPELPAPAGLKEEIMSQVEADAAEPGPWRRLWPVAAAILVACGLFLFYADPGRGPARPQVAAKRETTPKTAEPSGPAPDGGGPAYDSMEQERRGGALRGALEKAPGADGPPSKGRNMLQLQDGDAPAPSAALEETQVDDEAAETLERFDGAGDERPAEEASRGEGVGSRLPHGTAWTLTSLDPAVTYAQVYAIATKHKWLPPETLRRKAEEKSGIEAVDRLPDLPPPEALQLHLHLPREQLDELRHALEELGNVEVKVKTPPPAGSAGRHRPGGPTRLRLSFEKALRGAPAPEQP